MTDKEVGELWHQVTLDSGKMDGCANHGDLIAVIRKLVEERASGMKMSHLLESGEAKTIREAKALVASDSHCGPIQGYWIPLILPEFGIELRDWKEKL